jgi:hypothetical protein
MVTEKTVSPETEVAPNKRGSTVKYCCGACGILFVLIVGGIVAMFLFAERSCTTNFKIPDIFKPSPQAPVPPGGTFRGLLEPPRVLDHRPVPGQHERCGRPGR